MRTVSRSESHGLACVPKIALFLLTPSVSTKDRAIAIFFWEQARKNMKKPMKLQFRDFRLQIVDASLCF